MLVTRSFVLLALSFIACAVREPGRSKLKDVRIKTSESTGGRFFRTQELPDVNIPKVISDKVCLPVKIIAHAEETTCKEPKSSSEKWQPGDRCFVECSAGFIASATFPVCTEAGGKTMWFPNPGCTTQACGSAGGRYTTFPVLVTHLSSPFATYELLDRRDTQLAAYFVKYDKENMVPVYSATIYDEYNSGEVCSPRATVFKAHPCPHIKDRQLDKWESQGTGWHKGHLTPDQALAGLGEGARRSADMYVNIALQDGYTNGGPWAKIEKWMFTNTRHTTSPALVVTGVCPNDRGKIQPPPCFWKMMCINKQGKVRVVGFVAENTLLGPEKEVEKNTRSTESLQLRTQKHVLERAGMSVNDRQEMWTRSREALKEGRFFAQWVPSEVDCIGAWESDLTVFEPPKQNKRPLQQSNSQQRQGIRQRMRR